MSHTTILQLCPSIGTGAQDPSQPVAIAIKLNTTIISHLKSRLSGESPKLIVKDGNYSIKISDDLVFPCLKIPETLNVDIYSASSPGKDSEPTVAQYGGRLATKLNVITDSRKIKEVSRSVPSTDEPKSRISSSSVPSIVTTKAPSESQNTRRQPHNIAAYAVSANDTTASFTSKFLNLVALGPITETKLIKTLNLTPQHTPTFTRLLADFTQIYNANDSFTSDDKFPLGFNDDEMVPRHILKDRAYKELKPWSWNHFSTYERSLIIENIHHALTRLGYSDTHPLRRKICENNDPSDEDEGKKNTSLGGGFLISSKKGGNSAFRKSQTDSPKMPNLKLNGDDVSASASNGSSSSKRSGTLTTVSSPAINTTNNGSPQKRASPMPSNNTQTNSTSSASKRKLSVSSSSSSSDDDKHSKRLKTEPYTSPSSEEIEDDTNNTTLSVSNNPGSNINSRGIRIKSSESLPPPPSSASSAAKRLEYYNSLAVKFKFKYKEYETLYRKLKIAPPAKSSESNKKALLKLFELHNTLSQWKKTLWDFDNEVKSKSNIMNLSKHKKSTLKNKSLAVDDSMRSNSVSPVNLSGKANTPANFNSKFSRQSTPILAGGPKKPKISLDY
ncbi:uncharacterized protein RJT20DRAFT_125259 [Scheffersomyces xylosifermentans]|uniref:uncharacterized protein n=1 Tax=Scheffersomyces xylosifermentans TaxID=1304137 RepID=UPI00315DF455